MRPQSTMWARRTIQSLEEVNDLHRERYAAGGNRSAAAATLVNLSKEFGLLSSLVGGHVELIGKDFSFRGSRRPARDAKKLFEEVKQEIDADYKWMEGLDRQATSALHWLSLKLHAQMH